MSAWRRALPSADGRPLRLAHRGDHRDVPENVLAAMTAAMRVPGCDGVEVDVRTSSDGVAVLSHDETLERVFGRADRVGDLSAAALGAIGVPTLAEVLTALGATAFLDVELKEDVVPAAAAAIRAVRGDRPPGLVLSSFEDAPLASARRQAPAWPRWLNAVDLRPQTVTRAVLLDCSGVSVDWRALDRTALRRAREAGLTVAAWTVRDRATAERLVRLGVRALCVEGAALDPGA
jgi:glycerophosphoryl diester phosphodiesterase